MKTVGTFSSPTVLVYNDALDTSNNHASPETRMPGRWRRNLTAPYTWECKGPFGFRNFPGPRGPLGKVQVDYGVALLKIGVRSTYTALQLHGYCLVRHQ